MSTPKLSVFSTVKNGERFLVDTIESIRSQSFTDYEIVIVDGASSDRTVEILKRYPEIRWISEPDRSAEEGFHKAVRMCRGDYLIQCCVSDGFLDSDWFRTCVTLLDQDPEISLVYAAQQNMTEAGELKDVVYHELICDPPPQKRDFLPFWLATRFHFPETNYCVRRNVFLECFPQPESEDFFDRKNPFLRCVWAFNSRGYLPYFVPTVANFFKTHEQQLSETRFAEGMNTIGIYHQRISDYGKQILAGEVQHVFRNGKGEVIGRLDASALPDSKREIFRNICRRNVYLFESMEAAFAMLGTRSAPHRALLAFLARCGKTAFRLRRSLRSAAKECP